MVEAAGRLAHHRPLQRRLRSAAGSLLGVKHVLTVNSGSSANLVAFSTLTSPKLGARAIQPGATKSSAWRRASRPPSTPSCSSAPCRSSWTWIWPRTTSTPRKIEAAIGPKTKAIMLAHSLGNPFNLDVVTALCKKHGLWLVEDCCDALGATYRAAWSAPLATSPR
jgi:CDP-6-deoxy-D-xylo-4-hexulose-3-dehydrase